jgi:hypothetical protein
MNFVMYVKLSGPGLLVMVVMNGGTGMMMMMMMMTIRIMDFGGILDSVNVVIF